MALSRSGHGISGEPQCISTDLPHEGACHLCVHAGGRQSLYFALKEELCQSAAVMHLPACEVVVILPEQLAAATFITLGFG